MFILSLLVEAVVSMLANQEKAELSASSHISCKTSWGRGPRQEEVLPGVGVFGRAEVGKFLP